MHSSRRTLVVDCACGVGYLGLLDLVLLIQHASNGYHSVNQMTNIQLVNAPGDGPLNNGCGSEVVQKSIQPPKWYGNGEAKQSAEK
jgi:phosphoacetylglucosamine mutase